MTIKTMQECIYLYRKSNLTIFQSDEPYGWSGFFLKYTLIEKRLLTLQIYTEICRNANIAIKICEQFITQHKQTFQGAVDCALNWVIFVTNVTKRSLPLSRTIKADLIVYQHNLPAVPFYTKPQSLSVDLIEL